MKIRAKIFNLIFILFLFILPCSFYIINPIVQICGYTLDLEIGEKRNKTELIFDGSINNIGNSLEKFYNDRIPYRNHIIMADRVINGNINSFNDKKSHIISIESNISTESVVFKTPVIGTALKEKLEIDPYVDNYPFIYSDNGKVIFGQSNWLFYNEPEIMSIYKKEQLSDDDMKIIENEFKEIDKLAKEKGKKIYYVIAPEKQQIYSEYMPTVDVEKDCENMCEKITNIIKSDGINIIYPKDLLVSYKNKYRMYKKYDTHWNKVSAYLATKEFYKSMNIKLPDIETMKVEKTEEKGWRYEEYSPACRDLVLMANMNYEDYPFTFEYEINYGGTKNKHIDKKLCVIGDSFSTDMRDFIRVDFPDHEYLNTIYDLSEGIGFDKIMSSDIILFELVERHVPNMLLKSLQNLKKAVEICK